MPTKEVKAKLPQLYDAGGDINKPWQVYYSFRHPETGKMKRFNVTEGINKIKDYQQRMAAAQKLIEKWKRKLKNGYNPFEDEGQYIYEEVIPYAAPGKAHNIETREFDYTLLQHLSNALAKHKGIRPSTFKAYQGHLRVFRRTLEEEGKEDITLEDFGRKDAYNFLLELNVHNKTRLAYRATFRALFNRLIELEVTDVNPFANLKMPSAQTTNALRAFIPQEQKRIKNYCERNGQDELLMAIRFIYYCFIRPGELRNMTVSDIDLDKGKILVRAEVAKNKKRQYVTIPTQFLPHVADWVKELKPHYYIFRSRTGSANKKRGREHFRKAHKKILKALRFGDDVGLYSWKHTGVVQFHKHATMESLRIQLRHSSLDQVKHYLHSLGLQDNEEAKHNFPEIGE